MVNWEFIETLTEKICQLGRLNPIFGLPETEPFEAYFSDQGSLEYGELDKRDGKFTRREILTRYLLLSVVLDQGPDTFGVRELIKKVTADLYRREIRIFHRPIDFFKELNISIDQILEEHRAIKDIRKEEWARTNETNPEKYSLIFAQSARGIIATSQVLDYGIHRWGVPLCVPLLLEKDLETEGNESTQPLVDYLHRCVSAEIMSQQLKDNERYGLGSAIGDKACHLFAKIYVSVLKLARTDGINKGWTGISYEVPFDSNAGRVLFRMGFLLEFATLSNYIDEDVIQEGKGKNGTDYIRVTNIRGIKISREELGHEKMQHYKELVREYLKIGSNPRSAEIQRIPNLLIYQLNQINDRGYSVADFDDGLMHIGTKFCSNNANPQCNICPVKNLCKANLENQNLISNYTT